MGKGFQGALMRAFGANDHTIRVAGSRWISSHIIRLDFDSDDLLYPTGEKPTAWIRAWFPDLDGGGKLYQRAYTLLDPDPETGRFGLCFLVHEPAGPASRWAMAAREGDELVVQRLGGDGWDVADPQPTGYLLAGDMAAWPAITTAIEAVPRDVPVRVFLEHTNDGDRSAPIPEHPDLSVTWVRSQDDSRALVDALGDTDYRGWKVWTASETTATRLVRTYLQREQGHNKGTLFAQAYWIRGRGMGKELTAEELAALPQADDASTDSEQATPVATSTAVSAAVQQGSESHADGQTGAHQQADHKQAAPESVLAPARPALIIAALVSLLLAAATVVPLILFAEVARRFAEGAERSDLTGLGIAAVIVLAVGLIGSTVLMIGLHVFDQVFAAALRRKVLEKFTRLPLGWFANRRAGEIRKLAQDDVNALHYLVTHAVVDLVTAAVTPLAILGYLFSVNWALALVLLVPIIVYVVIMLRMSLGDRERMTQMLRYNATLPGEAERYIAAQPMSRVFGDAATVDLPGQAREMNDFMRTWQHDTIDLKTVMILLTRPMTSMVLVGLVGTALITTDSMAASALLPFLILGTSFGDRLLAISFAANGLREGMTAKSGLDLLLTARELTNHDEPVTTAGTGPASLRFDDVSFGYAPGRPVVTGISVELAAGTTTAIVGPSGAGKSTLAALAARLWDPDTGAVLLDGIDLRGYDEATLRPQIATVLQDVQIVRGSVAENIALGRPGTALEKIVEVARAAYIHDVIEALPEGYETIIDRDSLSGGQRQRLSIARAMLGDPRLVVLDEATAAADPDSEWEVRQGISKLLEDRTVLVIAHRLHTVADADQIVVVDDGRIVERGRREELEVTGGLYARMHGRAMEAVQ